MRSFGAAAAVVFALACTPSTSVVDAGEEESGGGDSGSDEAGCPVGALGCACTPGGGCDPGLDCQAGLCGEPPATETGACSALGCACEDKQDCDPGLECAAGSCAEIDDCGNGSLDTNEACDDGNEVDGDGCDNDCSYTQILDLAAGGAHTCALIEGGRIRCWGHNGGGQLGYGESEDIGDNETPAAAGDLPLPPGAVEIAAGGAHSCARWADGAVRCWGFNATGQLGYGNSFTVPAIGDDESVEGLAAVELGGIAEELDIGVLQTCVRASGQLRCWGAGGFGQLGQGTTANIGDDEIPETVGPVLVGGVPARLGLGGAHGCVVRVDGGLRCWGRNDYGQLGQGNTANVGDDELPSDIADVSLLAPRLPARTTITGLALGLNHSCAMLSNAQVLCWGANDYGQLGQASFGSWSDQANELPSGLPAIELGGAAVAIVAGYEHSCALLDDGALRCWGRNSSGQLGYGHDDVVGDDETPASQLGVELGSTPVLLTAGAAHSCALLDDQGVICWGNNEFGQLGYGFTHDVGDNESPVVAGTVELL